MNREKFLEPPQKNVTGDKGVHLVHPPEVILVHESARYRIALVGRFDVAVNGMMAAPP
ncbi:hypothetical protein [Nonomuraea maritima]|uniref:hypothetical protein n=1 Tax=Nonomuraea maritima TaxID=683260 RepID=UPI003714A902